MDGEEYNEPIISFYLFMDYYNIFILFYLSYNNIFTRLAFVNLFWFLDNFKNFILIRIISINHISVQIISL